MVTGEMVPPNF